MGDSSPGSSNEAQGLMKKDGKITRDGLDEKSQKFCLLQLKMG